MSTPFSAFQPHRVAAVGSIAVVDREIVMTCPRCGAGAKCDGKCLSCGLQMPRNSVLPVSIVWQRRNPIK